MAMEQSSLLPAQLAGVTVDQLVKAHLARPAMEAELARLREVIGRLNGERTELRSRLHETGMREHRLRQQLERAETRLDEQFEARPVVGVGP